MAKMGRPKSDNAKTKILGVRLSDETYERLLKYMKAFRVTQTEVVMKEGTGAGVIRDGRRILSIPQRIPDAYRRMYDSRLW